MAKVQLDAGGSSVPATFQILGVAELGTEWQVRNGRAATMGMHVVDGGGSAFNAATIDWPMRLARDEHVAQIRATC